MHKRLQMRSCDHALAPATLMSHGNQSGVPKGHPTVHPTARQDFGGAPPGPATCLCGRTPPVVP
eukprot:13967399-Alexandrium_andersonii.AAC.1